MVVCNKTETLQLMLYTETWFNPEDHDDVIKRVELSMSPMVVFFMSFIKKT